MPFPETNPALARALAARAYAEPTAVQSAVLEPEATGRDLLVSAQTGSGKTVAFGLAFAHKLLGSAERFERAGAPLALIIAPTRELAMQVQRELMWLYADTGARVASCVGGMDVRTEARALSSGCHIVVGTPGRIRDHLERGRLETSELRTVVLDEADEMLDLGFREDLQFILDATPAGRQTLLFSATMPKSIEGLARTYQTNALRIETISRNTPHADIEYRAIRTAPRDTALAVVNVLRFYDSGTALVFCATRDAVRRMHLHLAERGFSAVALSGEMTQNERNTAMQALRDGRAKVMVATDVAARGLDLPDLTLVIHSELPNDKETLLHRSGRTGRAGRKGVSVLIVPQPRYRRAVSLLQGAGVNATWAPAPTVEEIRALDQQRLISHAIFAEAATEEDLALGRALLAGRTAEEIAMALMRFHRAQLPAPEDLQEPGPAARLSPYQGRDHGDGAAAGGKPWQNKGARTGDRFERGAGSGFKTDRPGRAERPDREDMVWFRISIGREHNADPKWLLPLICRAGSVTKSEIGAIRIFDRDTRFQIAQDHADSFTAAAKAAPQKQGHISRVSAKEGAGHGGGHGGGDAAPRVHAGATPEGSPRPPREFKSHDRKPEGFKPKHEAAAGEGTAHAPRPPREFKPHDAKTSERPSFDRKPADQKPSEHKSFEHKPGGFKHKSAKPFSHRKGKPSLHKGPGAGAGAPAAAGHKPFQKKKKFAQPAG
jgi:ATP-dependent RNA helicase DeaD